MSELRCDVVQLGPLEKHPNADSLSITKVWGYTCVVRTADWKEGDLAVYIPVDSVVPNYPQFEFLKGHLRIRAARLRGVYSEGLLIPAKEGMKVGDNVAAELEITKYEPPEPINTSGENEATPEWFHHYTDIENYRRYPNVFQDGEQVVITEKIHGANLRVAYDGTRLWVGSHRNTKKQNVENPQGDTIWWKVIRKLQEETKCTFPEGYILHGEVYGNVQDLKYGAKPGELFVRFFDASQYENGVARYLDFFAFDKLCHEHNLPRVPVKHIGPWHSSLVSIADGPTDAGGDNIREGIVIKPTIERFYENFNDPTDYKGRAILKVISEAYHLRKCGTERH